MRTEGESQRVSCVIFILVCKGKMKVAAVVVVVAVVEWSFAVCRCFYCYFYHCSFCPPPPPPLLQAVESVRASYSVLLYITLHYFAVINMLLAPVWLDVTRCKHNTSGSTCVSCQPLSQAM